VEPVGALPAGAAGEAPRVAAAARAAAARFGLRAGDGKQVVELRAPVAVDKGTAGVALARLLGGDAPGAAVLAAGDDVTDEDLFRRARAELPRAVTVRVGDAAATDAEYRVDDPPAVAALLAAVLAARPAA
jgi:trehalose 6-phosphate phosphatase